MISLIQDRDTIEGWFLFDNSGEDASQDYLLKNQTIYKQISHIHGDLGKDMYCIDILLQVVSTRC
jgi:hypothetical protein